MKTFATKEKRSASAVRNTRPYVHYPMGPVQLAQRAEIRRILRSTGAQTKLAIGQPNDKYEKEADRVADQVMAMPDSKPQRQAENEEEESTLQAKLLSDQITSLVQRQEEPSEDEDEEPVQAKFKGCEVIQRLCPKCEQEMQAKQGPGRTSQISTNLESRINSLKGGGQPLDPITRTFFEPRFGYNFSLVRVHSDSSAADTAKSINARAFTLGNHVAMGSGEYQPNSQSGQRLLGHELTHVVQQNNDKDERISRVPTRGGIREQPPRYTYSTNCGWIDWGHTRPTHSVNLIAAVRKAIEPLQHQEAALQKAIAANKPRIVREDKCVSGYEDGEVVASATDKIIVHVKEFPSGLIEIELGGFEVNSWKPHKFSEFFTKLPVPASVLETLRSGGVDVRIAGFTDCVGSVERNQSLREQRQEAINVLLESKLRGLPLQASRKLLRFFKVYYPLDQYLESNATRAGRRQNRGVLIRIIPRAKGSAEVTTPKMATRLPILGSVVSGATVKAVIDRPLLESEIQEVALALFMIQSVAFEVRQKWTDILTKSSFSEEDLPSNLIGFYRALNGYTSKDIRSICDVWGKQRSLQHFKGYVFQKNRHFVPPNLPKGGRWPLELSTINPATTDGPLFRLAEILLETSIDSLRCVLDSKGKFSCK